jgi:hypothetical protein
VLRAAAGGDDQLETLKIPAPATHMLDGEDGNLNEKEFFAGIKTPQGFQPSVGLHLFWRKRSTLPRTTHHVRLPLRTPYSIRGMQLTALGLGYAVIFAAQSSALLRVNIIHYHSFIIIDLDFSPTFTDT